MVVTYAAPRTPGLRVGHISPHSGGGGALSRSLGGRQIEMLLEATSARADLIEDTQLRSLLSVDTGDQVLVFHHQAEFATDCIEHLLRDSERRIAHRQLSELLPSQPVR
jgi:hypothetical protein